MSGSSGNIAWELFYGLVVPTSLWQHVGFLVWFALDIIFVAVIVRYGSFRGRRRDRAKGVIVLALVLLLALYKVSRWYSDDGQQMTAYWSGILLQMPCGMDYHLSDLANEGCRNVQHRDLVGSSGSPRVRCNLSNISIEQDYKKSGHASCIRCLSLALFECIRELELCGFEMVYWNLSIDDSSRDCVSGCLLLDQNERASSFRDQTRGKRD